MKFVRGKKGWQWIGVLNAIELQQNKHTSFVGIKSVLSSKITAWAMLEVVLLWRTIYAHLNKITEISDSIADLIHDQQIFINMQVTKQRNRKDN